MLVFKVEEAGYNLLEAGSAVAAKKVNSLETVSMYLF